MVINMLFLDLYIGNISNCLSACKIKLDQNITSEVFIDRFYSRNGNQMFHSLPFCLKPANQGKNIHRLKDGICKY